MRGLLPKVVLNRKTKNFDPQITQIYADTVTLSFSRFHLR